jgi:rhodanese-related sulfurtransferase
MLLGQAPVMLDVRMPEEWQQIRIGEMVNIPLEFLEMQVRKRLDAEEPLLVICDSSFRSSLAIGLLERLSFKSPTVLRGGLEAWINAGFPLDTSETKPSSPGTHALSVPSASSAFRNLKLPERISVAQLLQMNRDLPGTFEIIDIRPAEQVADYNPTGASQVDLGDLLESSTWLAGEIPLVIVDRDGSLAMIAAGILSRKTSRPIKALLGGIESFWRTTGMNLKIYQTPAPFSRPVPEGSDDIPENRSIPGSTGSGEISPSRLPVSPDIESPGSAKKGGGC